MTVRQTQPSSFIVAGRKLVIDRIAWELITFAATNAKSSQRQERTLG